MDELLAKSYMNNGIVPTLQIVLGLHFKPITSHHKLSFNWYLPMGNAYLHSPQCVTMTMHHKIHPKSIWPLPNFFSQPMT
jgi:hypothetical protein